MSQQPTARPFTVIGKTSSVVVTGASGSASIGGARPKNPEIPLCVRIWNAGAATSTTIAGSTVCWLEGAGSATATTADTPLPAGIVEVYGLKADTDTLAFINASGSTSVTVYFTPGMGV